MGLIVVVIEKTLIIGKYIASYYYTVILAVVITWSMCHRDRLV